MEREGCGAGFWGGLIAAGLIALVGVFGPHGAGWRQTEARLQARVENALRSAADASLTVKMDGQVARLEGVARSQKAVEDAKALALRAAGPGGPWAGGVVAVDASSVAMVRRVVPFTWTATREADGGVALRGFVPDSPAKAALAARARALFPAVRDDTEIADGAPQGPWGAQAEFGLDQLARLAKGQVRFNGPNLIVLGEATAPNVQAIRQAMAPGLPAPFVGRFEVTEVGQGLAIPELAGIDLSQAGAEDCQAAFQRIMARNVINFDTASAVVAPGSMGLIENLRSVALRCDAFRIEVSGHTDNVGTESVNLQLSQDRADAVARLLREGGVAPDRVSARGFGVARPIGDNTSGQGRAQNRRIEFAVSQ